MMQMVVFGVLGLCAVSTAEAADVQVETGDGVALAATALGQGEKGVLLVHGQGRTRADWSNFGQKLSNNGFHVLAVDLRGHGASGGELDEAAWPLMVNDVKASTDWLRGHGANHVTIIGAEVGANLAFAAASGNDQISSVIMLSPGLNINGVKVSAAISAYGDRPLLLIADATDATSSRAAGLIADKVTGKKKLELVEGAGSGVKMINTEASIEGLVVGWMNDAYGGSEDLKATRREVSSGEVSDDITTSGTRFGEKSE